jgi:predicted nucleotidyltransferase
MHRKTSNRFLEQLEAHAADLRAFGVRRIGLFGSCLRGEQRPDSDVDVLVEFQPEQRKLTNLVQVGDYLESLFGRRVELLTPESLSPYIGPYILREVRYVQSAA